MKATRPLVVLRLDVWRDRVYFLLRWCGVDVVAWTPDDALHAHFSLVGGDVVLAVEQRGLGKRNFTCPEEWIRQAFHRQLATELAAKAIDRARQLP